MKKSILLKLSAIFLALPLFLSCNDDNKIEPPVIGTEEPQPISDHTLVFYIMGNGTGLTPTMDLGLNSIRSAASKVLSETNHVVVFYDRGDVTRLYEFVDMDGNIKEKEIMKYVSTDNCVDPQFMADVFKLIDDTCKSDSYGVVFSSHGGGWASTATFNEFIAETFPAEAQSEPKTAPLYCGQDGLIYMDIPEMASALDMSGLSFDYILFDACYMSSIEAIYDLRYFTNYIIASPCEVLAGGFPYKEIIPMLFTEGHQLEDVCESYVAYYQAQTGDKQSAVIALTDCSELDALAEEVRKVNASAGSYNPADIQAYEGFKSHLFFDLEHYCNVRMNGKLSDEFKAALKAAVPYSAHTDKFFTTYASEPMMVPITSSCGVSCFVPTPGSAASDNTVAAYAETEWAKATGFNN